LIFVKTPADRNYGTRSQAILLVDYDNKITFVEHTMQLSSLHVKTDISDTESNHNSFHQSITTTTIEDSSVPTAITTVGAKGSPAPEATTTTVQKDGIAWIESRYDFNIQPK
jgi:hypothetical protein